MVKDNSKYAIVKIAGKQYKIEEGKDFLSDKLLEGNVSYDVLMYKNGNDIKIGKPKLEGVKVQFKVINQEEKGKKVDVFKYKSKSRYRRHIGFRPKHTRLTVEKIG